MQNRDFTLNDFIAYIRQTKKDPGWDEGARRIALTAVEVKGNTTLEQIDSVEKQFQGIGGMTGERLYHFLQEKFREAIDITNDVARGGPGKGGFSGDKIIDQQEREQLRRESPVAAAVLDYVVNDAVRGRHGRFLYESTAY